MGYRVDRIFLHSLGEKHTLCLNSGVAHQLSELVNTHLDGQSHITLAEVLSVLSSELSDAVSTLASSRYTYYQALYDAQTARADLDEALGHLPPEIDGRVEGWETE